MRYYSLLALVLATLTVGCGFFIHYAKMVSKIMMTGHIVLGILTLVSILAVTIKEFITNNKL